MSSYRHLWKQEYHDLRSRILIEIAIEIGIGTEHSGDGSPILPPRGTDKSDGMTPIPISIAIAIPISIPIRTCHLNFDKAL